jgi:aminoglycoside 3-N-acetyltransferase
VRARLYLALRKLLSQGARNALKQRLAHARRRLAPLYRMRYGTVSAAELCEQIAARIPQDTEIVMVHCSYNDLQPTYTGGLGELLTAVRGLADGGRTVVMPAFFFADGEPVAYYRAKPEFDARRQASQMGVLSETFRRCKGIRRSLHPTHSVCAEGPLAEELVRGHHLASSTFGEGTPFGVMASRATAIVGIGTEYFRCLTQIHAAEDLLGDEFPLPLIEGRLPVVLRDERGSTHQYSLQIRSNEFTRRLELMEPLLSDDVLKVWRYRGISLFVADAGAVTRTLIDAAHDGQTVYEQLPIRRGGRQLASVNASRS